MADWKILMADDDPEDRSILEEAILELGPKDVLCFATNGEEALQFLEKAYSEGTRPCVIVLDLNMPRLSGTQTLAILKEDPRFREIPVVIYSTSINPLEREKCLQLGAQAYLVKPVSYRECIDMAKTFLSYCDAPAGA